jgi:hypothetical protein
MVSPYKQTETHFLTYIMEPQIKKSLNIPKVRSEVVIQRMTDDGHQVMAKAHIVFGEVC